MLMAHLMRGNFVVDLVLKFQEYGTCLFGMIQLYSLSHYSRISLFCMQSRLDMGQDCLQLKEVMSNPGNSPLNITNVWP